MPWVELIKPLRHDGPQRFAWSKPWKNPRSGRANWAIALKSFKLGCVAYFSLHCNILNLLARCEDFAGVKRREAFGLRQSSAALASNGPGAAAFSRDRTTLRDSKAQRTAAVQKLRQIRLRCCCFESSRLCVEIAARTQFALTGNKIRSSFVVLFILCG